MKIIGVTGGMGSGKSTVSRILLDLGAYVIDADRVAKQVLTKGSEALSELAGYFGAEIISEQGEPDTAKIAEIAFGNREMTEILNKVTHKYILEEIARRLEALKEQGENYIVVLDVPIPVEHGFLDVVDEVWVVTADKEKRIQRVMERSSLSYDDVIKRMDMQPDDSYYKSLADEIIENDGSVEELEKKIAVLFVQKKLR